MATPPNPNRWVVLCVLKTGGDFAERHVHSLRDQVARRFKADHEFVCFTDTFLKDVKKEHLWYDWKGWWSKLEMFLLWDQLHWTGRPCFFLDLDTVLTDDFVPPVPAMDEFWMIKDFMSFGNPRFESRWWASGLMMWRGDFSFIPKAARAEGIESVSKLYLWDQIWINHCLRHRVEEGTIKRRALNDVLRISSYKVHKLQDGLGDPKPQIVCFHGKPRPWEVDTPWVLEARQWQRE